MDELKKDLKVFEKSHNNLKLIIFRFFLYTLLGGVVYYKFGKRILDGLLSSSSKPPVATFLISLLISIGIFVYLRFREKQNKVPMEFLLFEIGYFMGFVFLADALLVLIFILKP